MSGYQRAPTFYLLQINTCDSHTPAECWLTRTIALTRAHAKACQRYKTEHLSTNLWEIYERISYLAFMSDDVMQWCTSKCGHTEQQIMKAGSHTVWMQNNPLTVISSRCIATCDLTWMCGYDFVNATTVQWSQLQKAHPRYIHSSNLMRNAQISDWLDLYKGSQNVLFWTVFVIFIKYSLKKNELSLLLVLLNPSLHKECK